MRRIGYRRMFPFVALLLYAGLIWFGCPYIWLDRHLAGAKPTTSTDTEPEWDLHCLWTTMPISEQLANGLNLPAVLAASVLEPLRDRMHLVCREAEYFGHAATGLFVPLLWYIVGWQIDKRGSPRIRRRTRLRKLLVYAGILIVLVAAVLVTASFFLTPGEFLVMRVSALGWVCLGACALFVRVRRAHAVSRLA